MKNLILAGCAAVALAFAPISEAATFQTKSANGNSAWGAIVGFPVTGSSETLRIVSVNYTNDTAAGSLSFRDGGTAFSLTLTNSATTSVTNQITGTNGLSVGALCVLQHLGALYTNTIVTWNQSTNAGPYGGTNVVMTTGGWGVIAGPGDDIYLMNAPVSIPVKAESSAQNGDCIYTASLSGRPVLVYLGAATATNKIYSASARSE